MEDRIEEGYIPGAINAIPIYKVEKILDQMKNCICKIKGKKIGTGFFCKILYNNELIPVLMTNYHVIDDNFIETNKQLNVYINQKLKVLNINKNSKIYSSEIKKYDLMIIKIKEEDIKYYLEIDDDIYVDDSINSYKEDSIYILHYPNNGNISVSFGYGINKNDEYDIKHLLNTYSGSSGGPILSLSTNKIIGIHKGCVRKNYEIFNIGTYLKYPLDELNKNNNGNKNNNIKNEIKIQLKINKDDINKEIYFLDNTDGDEASRCTHHDNLKELNELNTELYINYEKYKYKKCFIPKEEGIYSILLKLNITIKDCSFMFFGCKNIIDLDLSSFYFKNITNMFYMFLGCTSLKSLPDISKWDTKNVTAIAGIFSYCSSLNSLPDISNWDTKNVTDMHGIFFECSSLKYLPDISKWNTKNVTNMSYMFAECSSLKSLPDISKWDTKKVDDMWGMFAKCNSLKSLPDFYLKRK